MVMSGDRKYVMNNYPEPDKRLIYQFKCEAHERELHRELTKLDQLLAAWRNNELRMPGE